MKKIYLALMFITSLNLVSGNAFAATPTLLGKFGFWSAYSANDGAQQVCYMSITLRAQKAKKPKRGDIVMMITHRPFENSKDVFSYTAGTILKPASEVNIKIGPRTFNLFTQDDTAWSRDSATDRSLAFAIRAGAFAMASGISSKGYKIADKVSLNGSDKAYAAISKSCGVSVENLPKPKPKHKASPAPRKKPAAKKRKL